MANDLSNIKKTVFRDFVTRLGGRISNYTSVADVVMDDTANLQLADVYGVNEYTAQAAGSPTAQDILTSKNVVATAAFEKKVVITETDARDNPGLFTQIANQMADAAAWTIADLFWSTFTAGDTTAHPDATFTPAFFAANFSAPVVQSNLLTAALSDSSLSAARQVLREYKVKSGIPWGSGFPESELRLVTGPGLETTARALTAQPGQIYNGSGLESGSYQGIQPVVIPEVSDANDWWLIHRPSSPIVMWIRQAPTLRVNLADDEGRWIFYGQLEAAVVLKPTEIGYVMSKVA